MDIHAKPLLITHLSPVKDLMIDTVKDNRIKVRIMFSLAELMLFKQLLRLLALLNSSIAHRLLYSKFVTLP